MLTSRKSILKEQKKNIVYSCFVLTNKKSFLLFSTRDRWAPEKTPSFLRPNICLKNKENKQYYTNIYLYVNSYTTSVRLPVRETLVKTLSVYCSFSPGFTSRSSVKSTPPPSENTALFDSPRAGTLAPTGRFWASSESRSCLRSKLHRLQKFSRKLSGASKTRMTFSSAPEAYLYLLIIARH